MSPTPRARCCRRRSCATSTACAGRSRPSSKRRSRGARSRRRRPAAVIASRPSCAPPCFARPWRWWRRRASSASCQRVTGSGRTRISGYAGGTASSTPSWANSSRVSPRWTRPTCCSRWRTRTSLAYPCATRLHSLDSDGATSMEQLVRSRMLPTEGGGGLIERAALGDDADQVGEPQLVRAGILHDHAAAVNLVDQAEHAVEQGQLVRLHPQIKHLLHRMLPGHRARERRGEVVLTTVHPERARDRGEVAHPVAPSVGSARIRPPELRP